MQAVLLMLQANIMNCIVFHDKSYICQIRLQKLLVPYRQPNE